MRCDFLDALFGGGRNRLLRYEGEGWRRGMEENLLVVEYDGEWGLGTPRIRLHGPNGTLNYIKNYGDGRNPLKELRRSPNTCIALPSGSVPTTMAAITAALPYYGLLCPCTNFYYWL
jgi:hypothetical protein